MKHKEPHQGLIHWPYREICARGFGLYLVGLFVYHQKIINKKTMNKLIKILFPLCALYSKAELITFLKKWWFRLIIILIIILYPVIIVGAFGYTFSSQMDIYTSC